MAQHPNSLANLRPIRPEDRITNGRKGKPSLKRTLRTLLEAETEHEGRAVTYAERLALNLMRLACGGTAEHPVPDHVQLRAISEVADRAWGRPQTRAAVTLKQGPNLSRFVGKTLEQLTDEEFRVAERAIHAGKITLHEGIILPTGEGEFTEEEAAAFGPCGVLGD